MAHSCLCSETVPLCPLLSQVCAVPMQSCPSMLWPWSCLRTSSFCLGVLKLTSLVLESLFLWLYLGPFHTLRIMKKME